MNNFACVCMCVSVSVNVCLCLRVFTQAANSTLHDQMLKRLFCVHVMRHRMYYCYVGEQ